MLEVKKADLLRMLAEANEELEKGQKNFNNFALKNNLDDLTENQQEKFIKETQKQTFALGIKIALEAILFHESPCISEILDEYDKVIGTTNNIDTKDNVISLSDLINLLFLLLT